MLSDRYCQLLTAYVDGELSSRQRRHVVRLLHRSAEARQLLQQLKADARALSQLPRPPLPTDLTGPVLRRIAERNLTPNQHRLIKPAAQTTWIGPVASWAAAAAVLLVLGVCSYLYFVASLDQPAKNEIVQTQSEPAASTPPPHEPEPIIEQPKDAIPIAPHRSPAPKIDHLAISQPPKIVQQPRKKSKAVAVEKKQTPPKNEAALAERMETFHFDRVPDLLPVIVKLSDLDRLPARKKLLAELQKDNAFHLELPCPNGTKAFERVQNAARTQHIGLIVDKPAQERIKLKWRINYVLYLENITPEELMGFVRQIDAEDRKSAAGKPAEVQLECMVLTRLSAAHRKELATLLGIDPLAEAPSATGPLGADPHTSLSDATARQVGQSLAGQGSAPRPEPGKTAPPPADRIALVLASHPIRPSPGSDEIKHYLESRKPSRPGTLRVLLVLRSVS